jgi:hypothetical protein
MAQHTHYWSCGPLADWIRGTNKLKAGTAEEWNEWTTRAQMKHNFRYWVAEEALGDIQDFVTWPIRSLYSIKYYINNRWVSRTHSLTAHARDIKPGDWCDVGNRFLPCLFNELVDFVEIEQAWSHIAWGDKTARAKYNPPFWASGWWRWRVWRCPQAGLDHLDWEMTLTNEEFLDEDKKGEAVLTSQAIRAKELKELYTWWTVTYRNRPDPHDASGWSAYCDSLRNEHGDHWIGMNSKDPASKKASNKAMKLLSKIEKAYEKEDTEMLIRLIKIRQSLWT